MIRKKAKPIDLNYSDLRLAEFIQNGAIGILPTDTIYGLVACALVKKSVETVYKLKKRTPSKPAIILIGSMKQLDLFGISRTDQLRAEGYWPGPVSVILPCKDKAFHYLHRATDSLAFRLPDNQPLRQLLELTGPIIAPSANPEGQPPATSIAEAKKYFGDSLDFCVDIGKQSGKPSKLISLMGKAKVIRR